MTADENVVAILGNPVTTKSSGKFLEKFASMLLPSCERIFVINDGVCPSSEKCTSIRATKIAAAVKRRNASAVSSIVSFVLAQAGLSIGLLKCLRRARTVIVFPIVFWVPVVIAKIARRRVILYEAQDIRARSSSKKMLPLENMEHSLMMIARNIVLNISDLIVVEGTGVIEQNSIESYADKTIVCPQFIDNLRYGFGRLPSTREGLVGFIGSFDKRKGASEFARAVLISSVTHRDLKFVMVGTGELESEVASIAKQMGTEGVLNLTKQIDETQFPQFLRSLKVLVVPSAYEGLPNIVLESLASGTPVLSTSVGAIPSLIVEGVTGFLMADNTPECISGNLSRVLRSGDLDLVAKNGRDLIERDYTYEKSVGRWRDILAED